MGIAEYLSNDGPSMFERRWYQYNFDAYDPLGNYFYRLVWKIGDTDYVRQHQQEYNAAKLQLLTAFGFNENESKDFKNFYIQETWQTAFGCKHKTNDELIVFKIYHPDQSDEYRYRVPPKAYAHTKYTGEYIASQLLYTGRRRPKGPRIQQIDATKIPWF